MSYSTSIMSGQFEDSSEDEIKNMLITLDGRGMDAKRKALDILIDRVYRRGMDNGYDLAVAGYEGIIINENCIP